MDNAFREPPMQQGVKKGPKGGPPQRVVVRPMASPARTKGRHRAILIAFGLIVVLPLVVISFYMASRAVDQYAADVGFTVRQEEAQLPSGLGGIAGIAGITTGGGASDSDILYEFIQSQTLVKALDDQLDLWAHYTAPHDADPVFALRPGGTIEDLGTYWRRIVSVDYDRSTGLIGLEVRAFDPAFSKALADQILTESETLVNALNAKARVDLLREAEADVANSLERLKAAREALVTFRTRTQIVDPETDLETRMGVQTQLQSQLAQALIDLDVLSQNAREGDTRLTQARQRVEVIRSRLAEERASFATQDVVEGQDSYPTLIAEYERLAVDREYAEETYTGALAQLDAARANASRQSSYLAAYILPIEPEAPEYPKRLSVTLIAAVFLLLAWGMFSLIYYSVRDRT